MKRCCRDLPANSSRWRRDEEEHRRRVEIGLLRVTQGGLVCAFVMGMTLILGAIYLLHEGQELGGLSTLVAAITGLVGAFIFAKRTRSVVDQSHTEAEPQ